MARACLSRARRGRRIAAAREDADGAGQLYLGWLAAMGLFAIVILVVALNAALIVSLSRTVPGNARVCPDAGPCRPAAAVNPTSPSAEKSR